MALGFFARPLGAFVFGVIGDRWGRKKAIRFSLIGMSFASFAIAFLPTYEEIGFFAPYLLLLTRVLQSFFSAGETGGGAVFLLEQTTQNRQDWASSLYGASTILGALFASFGIYLFTFCPFVRFFWRILYLFGCLTALIAFFFRNQEKPKEEKRAFPSFSFLLKEYWPFRKNILLLALASGFSYASYMLSLVLLNGVCPIISSISTQKIFSMNSFLLIIDFFALLFFGLIAKILSRKILMILSLFTALIGSPFLLWLLPHASFSTILLVRILLVLIGCGFSAPLHSWAQTLFPPSHRFLAISFGYTLGAQILGTPTTFISLWLYQKTENIASLGSYWSLLALLCLSAFTAPLLKKRKEQKTEENV